jgi:hypothetical protein
MPQDLEELQEMWKVLKSMLANERMLNAALTAENERLKDDISTLHQEHLLICARNERLQAELAGDHH